MPKLKDGTEGADTSGDATNRVDYDDEANPAFVNKSERQMKVQGYGPIGVALMPDEAESDEEGILEDNNVSDRI